MSAATGKGFAAGLLDQSQRLGRVDRWQLVDPDQRAVGGQAHRRRLPDPAGGPGDQGHLAREAALHGVLPLRLQPAQKMAIGFQGEPVAPGSRSGSPVTMNSKRPSAAQASASSSSCRLSEMHMPMATSCRTWIG